MKSINIGIVGLGTVGRGVYEAIINNGRLIEQRTGVSLAIKGVCDTDKKILENLSAKDLIKTGSADELIKDDSIHIIIELIGGINPAREIILNALKHKKHVVTANKALLSEHWKELFDEAHKNKRFLQFEASVGGAIPIIRTLCRSFIANNISTIYGILNGTTNFILTEMSGSGCSFENALKIAQKKGIAESDPELDISGQDSAHKLGILSLIGFGLGVQSKDIYTEGIAGICPEDIRNIREWGYSVKLLAIAKDTPEGVQLRVHPTLLPLSHLLSDVRGADNAIFVKGDLIGESLLFGKGAGSRPTSSSVIGDVVEIAKYISVGNEASPASNLNYAAENKHLSKIEDLEVAFYLRFSVIDKPGVLAGISTILAENSISIADVSQREQKEGETVPVVILTHKAKEGNMCKAIEKIDKLEYVTAKTVVIRKEE
jgi:homoserine dehydrogenase